MLMLPLRSPVRRQCRTRPDAAAELPRAAVVQRRRSIAAVLLIGKMLLLLLYRQRLRYPVLAAVLALALLVAPEPSALEQAARRDGHCSKVRIRGHCSLLPIYCAVHSLIACLLGWMDGWEKHKGRVVVGGACLRVCLNASPRFSLSHSLLTPPNWLRYHISLTLLLQMHR